MTMTDPIADLLTRIRNAHTAKHDLLDVPASNVKTEICRILTEQGYLAGWKPNEEEGVHKTIRIFLKYNTNGEPAIRHMARVSKPGRRVYKGTEALKPVLSVMGVGIVSTSQGLLSDAEAREKRVGGELLCEIW